MFTMHVYNSDFYIVSNVDRYKHTWKYSIDKLDRYIPNLIIFKVIDIFLFNWKIFIKYPDYSEIRTYQKSQSLSVYDIQLYLRNHATKLDIIMRQRKILIYFFFLIFWFLFLFLFKFLFKICLVKIKIENGCF